MRHNLLGFRFGSSGARHPPRRHFEHHARWRDRRRLGGTRRRFWALPAPGGVQPCFCGWSCVRPARGNAGKLARCA